MPNTNIKENKPEFYFENNFRSPDFRWKFFGFGVFVGRIKQEGRDIVWNVYTPWFSFGYAW